MLATLGAIGVLLILSAFFSGSETALTAASRPVMHHLARQGNRRAHVVNRLHAHQDRFIGSILLGNNLVNILASALATSLLIALYGEAGVAYATIAMTLLILIFAEILPKTYAFRNANKTSLVVAPVVRALVFLLAPVIEAINWVVRATLRPFGVDLHAEDAFATSGAEVRGAIAMYDGEGESVKHERAMLRSVLDLAEVRVGKIMIHRKNVVMVDADAAPETVIAEVLDSPYTRVPVWREEPDKIVGVLHAKAMLRAVQGIGPNKLDTLDVVSLASEPWFVPETTPLHDQLEAFRQRREHFAIVIDEYGAFMGIVTLEDILEEIVGEIADEHDVAVAGVKAQPDGSYVVPGTATIRDLNREYEWDLPDAEAATVAGLILHESRRIPDVGQAFLFHGFRFEILRRHRHQITSVRMTPPSASNDVADPRP